MANQIENLISKVQDAVVAEYKGLDPQAEAQLRGAVAHSIRSTSRYIRSYGQDSLDRYKAKYISLIGAVNMHWRGTLSPANPNPSSTELAQKATESINQMVRGVEITLNKARGLDQCIGYNRLECMAVNVWGEPQK